MSHAHATGTAGTFSRFLRALRRTLLGTVLIVLLLLGGTAFRVWQVARADERRPVDIVIVLGAAQYNGEPSGVLEARLDQALELYEQGLTDYVVTVGGRKTGDNYTEAGTGRTWLIEHGVDRDRVIAVDEGSDTLRSVEAVTELADERGWNTALIVSDPWHSYRAETMANDLGLRTWSSPTRTGPIVQTRRIETQYIVRETAAMLYYRITHSSAEITGAGLG